MKAGQLQACDGGSTPLRIRRCGRGVPPGAAGMRVPIGRTPHNALPNAGRCWSRCPGGWHRRRVPGVSRHRRGGNRSRSGTRQVDTRHALFRRADRRVPPRGGDPPPSRHAARSAGWFGVGSSPWRCSSGPAVAPHRDGQRCQRGHTVAPQATGLIMRIREAHQLVSTALTAASPWSIR